MHRALAHEQRCRHGAEEYLPRQREAERQGAQRRDSQIRHGVVQDQPKQAEACNEAERHLPMARYALKEGENDEERHLACQTLLHERHEGGRHEDGDECARVEMHESLAH